MTGSRTPKTPNGLLIPPRFSFRHLLDSPRFAMQKTLLQLPHAEPQNYTDQVNDVLALMAGTYRSPEGEQAHVVPGEGAALQVWILGSSGGESAEVAGRNGLRFAANYHVSPATVLEAADGYRAAFRPSAVLGRPYVSVSADVVVAGAEAAARELATGYGLWAVAGTHWRLDGTSRPGAGTDGLTVLACGQAEPAARDALIAHARRSRTTTRTIRHGSGPERGYPPAADEGGQQARAPG